MKIIITILLVSILFTSCKTQNILENKTENDLEYFRENGDYQYQIRKNDKITISVWGENDLSVGSVYGIYSSNEVYGKWLMVDDYGNIEIPKLGSTNVLGKTVPQLKTIMKTELKKLLVNPIIDIKVLNKEITILGEVRSPATIVIDKDQNTLFEIISKTGGFDLYANLKKIKILRQEGENVRVTNIDLTNNEKIQNININLHPGDVVIVPSKKNKEFDKRISVIIPLTSTVTAATILMGLF